MPMDENDSYLKPGMKDEKEPKGVTHGRPATGVSRKLAALKKASKKKMVDYGYTKVPKGSAFDKNQQKLYKAMEAINKKPAETIKKRMGK
jgi:hypothetical protein